jgi:hypothetical protein
MLPIPAAQPAQVGSSASALDRDCVKSTPASLLNDVARGLRRDHRDIAAERPGRLGDGEQHHLPSTHRALIGGNRERGTHGRLMTDE